MIKRLIFGLALMIVLVEPTIAASVVRIRILTEDAYLNQCRDGICVTVQVTRETFSDGGTNTSLFVSASDESGNALFQFNEQIDNSLFVRQGIRASVKHWMAVVSWTANGLYTEEADSTRRVVDKRESPLTEPHAFRLTEKERIQGATAEGEAGPSPNTVGINSEVLSSGGFVNAFITVRRTTRIDRVLPSNE